MKNAGRLSVLGFGIILLGASARAEVLHLVCRGGGQMHARYNLKINATSNDPLRARVIVGFKKAYVRVDADGSSVQAGYCGLLERAFTQDERNEMAPPAAVDLNVTYYVCPTCDDATAVTQLSSSWDALMSDSSKVFKAAVKYDGVFWQIQDQPIIPSPPHPVPPHPGAR